MSIAGPEPLSSNPVRRLAHDFSAEQRARTRPWPPGDGWVSPWRTHRMAMDPLPLLLDAYERHGPVFTLRIMTSRVVFMLGPEANHFVLVGGFDNFHWREGFQDLAPLLGDGLLTIDGDFHRHSRRSMLPAFHHDRVAGAEATMVEEAERALAAWRDGEVVDLYRWTREVALRIAMRVLFGFDPDAHRADLDPATEFERALGFYGNEYVVQVLRGPGTPWRRMLRARERLDRLIYAEIARRRRTGERGDDVLSLLLDAFDEDRLVRDQVMTLLFAGHDTTTSTVAFLFHELAQLEDDLDPARLEPAIDETLRLYPPAWIGPRRSVREFEFAGYTVPADVSVNYSSWASHRLPGVWDEPDAFRPERFLPENRAKIPRGAYVPFGGGSRTCIGMRFGLLEVRVLAREILQRYRLRPLPGYRLRIRQTPTLGPRDGLPLRISARF